MANEVKISGVLCSNMKQLEKATVINISFMAGRKPTGEYSTGFISCFFYGKPEDLPAPKSRVTVKGWIIDNPVTKNGTTFHNMMIGTKDVKLDEKTEKRLAENKKDYSPTQTFDDSLPWE